MEEFYQPPEPIENDHEQNDDLKPEIVRRKRPLLMGLFGSSAEVPANADQANSKETSGELIVNHGTETIQPQPTLEAPPEFAPPLPNAIISERPEKVFEKVVEAADRNMPIEKEYELRHEIKDKPIEDEPGALPLSTILSQMQSEASGVFASAITPQSPLTDSNKPAKVAKTAHNRKTRLYRQAVRNGFSAGLVLILLAVIAILVKK